MGDLARSASGSPGDAAGIARLASTGFMKAMSTFAKGWSRAGSDRGPPDQ